MARPSNSDSAWPLESCLLDEASGLMEEISLTTVSDFLADLGDFGVEAAGVAPVKTTLQPAKESSPSSTSSGSTKRLRTTPKEELEYLHSKQRYLLGQLHRLQATVAQAPSSDPWQKRAQNQAQAAQRALQENARLKAALEDQLKMIQALERVFQKKPKVVDPTPKHGDLLPWRRAILGVSNREADIEALLRSQYDKLDTEFIRHHVYQLRDTLTDETPVKREFVQSQSDSILLHFVKCKRWPINFVQYSQILWDFVSLNTRIQGKVKVDSERLQSFQNDTIVYTRHVANAWIDGIDIPPVEGRTAAMRFVEPDRVVIVWKSIAEDALVPFMSDRHIRDNKCGWAVITPHGPDACSLAAYSNLTTPVFPTTTSGAMTEMILSLYETNSGRFDAALTAVVNARRRKSVDGESASDDSDVTSQ
ncbi:hypothetical protein ACHHYP_11563 [Achlya hypogyna]|uniref:M96 mating-specific protein family n=1 Tax=Achlya hypogyna TaxID=1202772 RepID=A0A1V9YJ20_ACHHY|nr:hypothetical protein ACHHYP_11563 [Achlya hypogyna]